MAEYLGNQIILGKLVYSVVVGKKPELKSAIDTYLIEKDRTDLIVK